MAWLNTLIGPEGPRVYNIDFDGFFTCLSPGFILQYDLSLLRDFDDNREFMTCTSVMEEGAVKKVWELLKSPRYGLRDHRVWYTEVSDRSEGIIVAYGVTANGSIVGLWSGWMFFVD